ncbi:hypothetical protein GCM10009425_29250 [Pseudomonas asuensis]|uniref:DUF3137 domain-containing protein n=1 Tax=Pseudomonas asuensis TaxID=1825787 RepID=A0ABQ2GX42_9PSED|nr:hypothetical protein [Pseudomonas asuensis]GGM16469.1 hypothetical protein GCM10009425_29250 [Pseudomonas asuensis]
MRGLKFSHNARLGRLVDDGYRELEKATSRDDLFAIIDTFESFPGPKTFQPTLGLGSLVSGALLILLSLILYNSLHSPLDFGSYQHSASVCIGIVGSFAVLAGICILIGQANNIPMLSKVLIRKMILIEMKLHPLDDYRYLILERISADFGDYQREGHSRELVVAQDNSLKPSSDPCQSFSYYELAYAEKRVEVNYNTERARDECKEVIHHFKRYSLIFDFQGLRGLTIRTHAAGILSDRRVWLDTRDSVFDQLFRLSGDSLLECETLLKNDLLGLFIELESFLTRPSLEFSEKGQLCLSFDDDLLKPAIEEDLSLPAALRIKLEHGTATSRFIEVLEWIERLQKQVNTITPSA